MDFVLKPSHRVLLAVVAAAALVIGIVVDARGMLVNSMSSIVAFSVAAMLVSPVVRLIRQRLQDAVAALYVMDLRSFLMPAVAASGAREPDVEQTLERRGLTLDSAGVEWIGDLEALASAYTLGGRLQHWDVYQRLRRGRTAFGIVRVDDLPAEAAGPLRVLFGFFPREFDAVEHEFPSILELVKAYVDDPGAALDSVEDTDVESLAAELDAASRRVAIAIDAAENLLSAIDEYLREIGAAISDHEIRLHR